MRWGTTKHTEGLQ